MADNIESRLVRIEEGQKAQREALDRIESRIQEVCMSLHGHPGGDIPGLMMEVDRIKRTLSFAVWTMRAIAAAVAGLIVEWVRGILRH